MNPVTYPTGTLTPNSGNMNTRQLLSSTVYTQSLASACGRIGPPGPPGISGPKGPQGDKGGKGDKGTVGDIGPKGPQGPEGDLGLTGPNGDKGPKGPQGQKGEIGFDGKTGPAGPKGDTGPRGDTGPIGLTGPPGESDIGTIDQVLNRGNIAKGTISAYIPEIRIRDIRPYDGYTYSLSSYAYFENNGFQQRLYSLAGGPYIDVNGSTFLGSTIRTTYITSAGASITNLLYSTAGISTLGSIINTRSDGTGNPGRIFSGGLLTADAGISSPFIDGTTTLLTIGGSGATIVISKSGASTSILSPLTCSSSVTSTSIVSTNNTFNINSSGLGTFVGIVSNTIGITTPSVQGTGYSITSTGATFAGISCGGSTLTSLRSPTDTYSITTAGLGTFSGISSSTGITATFIASSNFSISSSGELTINKITRGSISMMGNSITVSDTVIYEDGITAESLTVSGNALFNKTPITIGESTTNTTPFFNISSGTTTIGMFSRKNGRLITSSTVTLNLATIPYDTFFNYPVDSVGDASLILPNTIDTGPAKFSPLRFYISNSSTAALTVRCLSALLWGPSTGPTLSIAIPPLKRISVTALTTDANFITASNASTGSYYILFENMPDTMDTLTSNPVYIGRTFASSVLIGNASTTTTLSGSTFTSAGITFNTAGMSLGTNLNTINMGNASTTTTLLGSTFTSAGISFNTTGISLGRAIPAITIGSDITTTTLSGSTFTSAGITFNTAGMSLGTNLTTINMGNATTTTTLLGSTFTSSGITFNTTGMSLGTNLTTINVGSASTTTTLLGNIFTSAGISFNTTGVSLGRAIPAITIGSATTTTTLSGSTFTSAGMTFNTAGMSLGTNLTTITVGSATSTTTMNGAVVLGNNPTASMHAVTKNYVDTTVDISTLYLSASTALSAVLPTTTTSTSTFVTSATFNSNSDTLVGTFTLPSTSSLQYRLRCEYVIVNVWVQLTTASSANSIQFFFKLKDKISTSVSVAVNTKTLLTCRIPLTTNEIISSNLPLTINAQSTTGSIANTVSIYYGGSDCHLLFVNNLYPLYHQVFNPVGTIIMYAAKSTPPPGYLFCDGAWYSTSSADNIYYGLYSVILTTYGALGTTAFYVPNLKNRFPLGANSTSTLLSLQGASTGGQVQLVADNLPAHGHTAIFSSSQQLLSSLTATSGDGTQSQRYASSETINKSEVAGSVTVYGNTNTLTDYYQPYTVVNYIIKY